MQQDYFNERAIQLNLSFLLHTENPCTLELEGEETTFNPFCSSRSLTI